MDLEGFKGSRVKGFRVSVFSLKTRDGWLRCRSHLAAIQGFYRAYMHVAGPAWTTIWGHIAACRVWGL